MSSYGRALLMDLDGTIIQTKSGKTFPKNVDDWEFIPGVLARIREAHDFGFPIYIVTNQGGISKGYIRASDLETKLENIVYAIKDQCEISQDNEIAYRYCGTMGSYFHKPNPGMAYDLALEDGLMLHKSIMVGDASGLPGNHSDSDLVFAENINATYIDVNEFIKYGVGRFT